LAFSSYLELSLSLKNAQPFEVTPVEAKEIDAKMATEPKAAQAKPLKYSTVSKETSSGTSVAKAVVEARVREYFSDVPVMANIAWCESKFTHSDRNGNVLRGIVASDVGVMQINEYYHTQTAHKLGIDLHSLTGNLAYARYLYEREGTRPWNSSAHCWKNRPIAMR
jgi:hypothetical protein